MAVTILDCNYLTDFRDYVAKNRLSADKFYLKSLVDSDNETIIVNSTSLLNKYFDVLMQYTKTKTFTSRELLHYKYQPKLFCYDTYGSVELWVLLLKINNMTTVLDFNKETIKVPNMTGLPKLLNEILTLESRNIEINKQQYE